NHYDPIAHKIKIAIDVFVTWEWFDHHIIANSHVLIQDGTFDMAIFANPNWQRPAFLLFIVVIRTHQDAIFDDGSFRDLTANAHYGMRDLGFTDAAAFCDQHILQFTAFHRGTWQKTGVSIDG